MPFTENASQALGLAAAPRHAATINNTTGDTGGIDMRKWERAIFFFSVGTNASSGSVIFKLQESAADSTYTDITSAATAAITTASKCGSLEIRADQLTDGQRYVRCRCTESASQAVTVSVLAIGVMARQKPGGKGATETATVAERYVH